MELDVNLDTLFLPILKRKYYEVVRTNDVQDVQNNVQTGGALTRSEAKRLKLQSSDDDKNLSTSSEQLHNPVTDFNQKVPSETPVIDPTVTKQPTDHEVPNRSQVTDPNEISTENLPNEANSSNLHPVNEDFSKDTVVVSNDFIEAHIHQTFHRHQKIFQ